MRAMACAWLLCVVVCLCSVQAIETPSVTLSVDQSLSAGVSATLFTELVQAWDYIRAQQLSTSLLIDISLAAGSYYYPNQSYSLPAGYRIRHSAAVSNVFIRSAVSRNDSQGLDAPLLIVTANTSVEWVNVHFFGFASSSASTDSQWKVARVSDTASWTMFNCTIIGDNVINATFKIQTMDLGSMNMTNVLVKETYIELALSGNSRSFIDQTIFHHVSTRQQALVSVLDTATVYTTDTWFNNTVGTLFLISDSAKLILLRVTVNAHSCDMSSYVLPLTFETTNVVHELNFIDSTHTTVPFGIAYLSKNARIEVVNSQFFHINGYACTAGLFGLYDKSSSLFNILLATDVTARLLYAEGTSNNTIMNSNLLNIYEVPNVGHIISARSFASVSIINTILKGNVGSYIFLESSILTFYNSTIIDTICPTSKSYLIALMGSAKLTLNKSSIVNTQASVDPVTGVSWGLPNKACTIVDAADNVQVTVLDSTITGYYCRSSCFSSTDSARYSIIGMMLNGNILSDSGYALLNFQNSREVAHTLINSTMRENTEVSVGRSLYGISVVMSTLEIISLRASGTKAIFNIDNFLSSILYLDITSSASVKRSTFIGNKCRTLNLQTYGGAIFATGNLSVVDSSFFSNTAKHGGAVALHVTTTTSTSSYYSFIASNFVGNKAEADGGAIYISGLTSDTTINITGTVFRSNVAKRGGAWFTTNGTKSIMNVNNAYVANNASGQGSDFASYFDHFEFDMAATGIVNSTGISIKTGQSINAIVAVVAKDYFGQIYRFGSADTVLLAKVVVYNSDGELAHNVKLKGEATKAVFTGRAHFHDIQVYGPSGQYHLVIAKLKNPTILDKGSISAPLTIAPCTSPSRIESSVIFGPDYPTCVPAICSQGCSSHGQCISLDNCVCNSPAYEGLACQLRADMTDSIILQLPRNTYPNYIGTRDALIKRLTALSQPNYELVFRYMYTSDNTYATDLTLNSTVESTAGSTNTRNSISTPSMPALEFKFSLVRKSTGHYVQAHDLLNAQAYLQSAAPNSTFANEGQGDPWMFSWPPAKIAFVIFQVDKQAVYETRAIGVSLLSVIVLLMCKTIVVGGLLARKRNHPVVKNANFKFLGLTTFAITAGYSALLPFLGIPSSLKCASQIVYGFTVIALALSVLFARATLMYLTCDNSIICKGTLPDNYVKQYAVMIASSTMIIWALALVYSITADPTPAVFTSEATGPYWTCVSETTGVGVAIYSASVIVLGLLFFGGFLITWKARRAESLSNEPRYLLLVYWNSLLCLAIFFGISYGIKTLGVEIQFAIMCVVTISLLGMWSATWLDYKVYVVYGKSEHNKLVSIIPTKNKSQTNDVEHLCELEECKSDENATEWATIIHKAGEIMCHIRSTGEGTTSTCRKIKLSSALTGGLRGSKSKRGIRFPSKFLRVNLRKESDIPSKSEST